MSTELSLPPVRPTRNKVTGRFMKGNVPHNKGKTWDETMSKRGQRNAKKGWKNLERYRIENGKKYGGRNRRPVVVVTDDGKFCVFKDAYLAAAWLKKQTGKSCCRENIGRCCRENQSRKTLNDNHGRPTEKINTDHRYMGFRWYFESDTIWYAKTKRNG